MLLIGDVALIHDLGGLLAASRLGLKLTVVLLHNDGGGIFHFLPVAGEGDDFVEHVATPHGLDFAHAAALFGLRLRGRRGRRGLPRRARPRAGRPTARAIVAVRTDREANVALHGRCGTRSGQP